MTQRVEMPLLWKVPTFAKKGCQANHDSSQSRTGSVMNVVRYNEILCLTSGMKACS